MKSPEDISHLCDVCVEVRTANKLCGIQLSNLGLVMASCKLFIDLKLRVPTSASKILDHIKRPMFLYFRTQDQLKAVAELESSLDRIGL